MSDPCVKHDCETKNCLAFYPISIYERFKDDFYCEWTCHLCGRINIAKSIHYKGSGGDPSEFRRISNMSKTIPVSEGRLSHI